MIIALIAALIRALNTNLRLSQTAAPLPVS